MAKHQLTPEEESRLKQNIKQYSVATGQDPAKHGKLPFHLFDPGKGDPWRELHLVDADNHGVTTLGPLQDTTDMTLGNALYIMECCNSHEDLVKKIADLEEERSQLQQENKNLLSEIRDLRVQLDKKDIELRMIIEKINELKNEV